MPKRKMTAALLILTSLAACELRDESTLEPEPVQPVQTAEITPEPEETVSILRPEIKSPVEPEPPLKSLKTLLAFPDEDTELNSAAEIILQDILASPQMAMGGPITLRGHSDAGGDEAEALRASRKRAESVRDWMIENGLDEARIRVVAFGDQNPVAPNLKPDGTPNPQGRARNRRVEIEIPAVVVEASEPEETGSIERGD